MLLFPGLIYLRVCTPCVRTLDAYKLVTGLLHVLASGRSTTLVTCGPPKNPALESYSSETCLDCAKAQMN